MSGHGLALRWLCGALVGSPGDAPSDWPAVLTMARRGGLGPLLARRLDILQVEPPAEVRAALDAQHRAAVFDELRGRREQSTVLGALAGGGVHRTILLKGAVLRDLVYPDPALRLMKDLDLLVASADEGLAAAALVGLGYREESPLAQRPASRRANHERLFARDLVGPSDTTPRLRFAVELHTGFAQSFRYRIDYDAVIARARAHPAEAEQAGSNRPVGWRADDADLLLHLAVHLAREQFLSPLKNLLDVHLWVTHAPLDWDLVIERARRWGAATALSEALRLSKELFGTQLPSEVERALAPGTLRSWWLKRLHRPERNVAPGSMRGAQALGLLPLMDSTGQRARFVHRYAALRLGDLRGRDGGVAPR